MIIVHREPHHLAGLRLWCQLCSVVTGSTNTNPHTLYGRKAWGPQTASPDEAMSGPTGQASPLDKTPSNRFASVGK
jgi:hypothetical protein